MKTKIYVIKLRQIIKVVIAVIVIALIVLAIMSIVKGGNDKPTFNPGVYTSQIILHNSPVNVEVEVSKHSIESVRVLDLTETQQVFYPLFSSSVDEIADRIVAEQSCDIVLDKDYSVTGGILLDAVRQALEEAEK